MQFEKCLFEYAEQPPLDTSTTSTAADSKGCCFLKIPLIFPDSVVIWCSTDFRFFTNFLNKTNMHILKG